MKCERCIWGRRAVYSVRTELLDLSVCENCAREARRLGLSIKGLETIAATATKIDEALS